MLSILAQGHPIDVYGMWLCIYQCKVKLALLSHIPTRTLTASHMLLLCSALADMVASSFFVVCFGPPDMCQICHEMARAVVR